MDIREAIWVMNKNKIKKDEVFQAKFFKHGICAFVYHLLDIFNHVFCTSCSLAWSHHIIHQIYKLGHISNPNNYRMIMVVHTFLKLYATVLHRIFSSEIESRNLRDKGQEGFQPTH